MNIDILRRNRDLRRLGEKPGFDLFFWIAFALLLTVSLYSYHHEAVLIVNGLETQTGAAHPLWTGGVAMLCRLGLTEAWAAAAISTLFKMLAFLAVQRMIFLYLAKDAPAKLATFAALFVMIVTAIRIPTVNPAVFEGVGSPAAWSPGPQAAAPLIALACLVYAAHCVYEVKTLQWKQILCLAFVLLLGGLCRPALLQAFLPALGVYLVILYFKHPQEKQFILRIGAALLPAAAWITARIFLNAGGIAPSFSLQGLWLSARNMLLMAALPLLVLLLTPWKETFRNPVIVLCLLFAAASVLRAAFFEGVTEYAAVNWAGMSAAFLLWAVMLPRFISVIDAYHRDRRKLREYANHGALSTASLAREQKRLNRLSGGFLFGFILTLWHLYSALYYLYELFLSGSI